MRCIERRIRCDCGCGNEIVVDLAVRDRNSYDVSVHTVCSCFFAKQEGPWRTLERRLKAAWFMLTGQEYLIHDVVMDANEWHALVENMWRDLIGINGKEEF